MQEYIQDIYHRYNASVGRLVDADGVARTFGIAPIDAQLERNYQIVQFCLARAIETGQIINTAFPENSLGYIVANLAMFLYVYYNNIDTFIPEGFDETITSDFELLNTDF